MASDLRERGGCTAAVVGKGAAPEEENEISLAALLYPELNGLRYDGQRWVDATRPDRPFVPIIPFPVPVSPDMFGGSGHIGLRKYYPIPGTGKRAKCRRRGPQ